MRWPEFGYGIALDGEDYRLVAWRGARDERKWQDRIRRGGHGEWPWVPNDHPRVAYRSWDQEEAG